MKTKRIRLALLGAILAAVPAVAPASSSDEAAFHIVRFGAPITDASRAALDGTGATVIDYEPHHAYVVWATAAQADAARRLGAVEAVGPVPAERKIHPMLLRDGTPVRYVEIAARSSRAPALLRLVDGLGTADGIDLARADGLVSRIAGWVPQTAVARIAADPAVLYIGPASRAAVPEDEATAQIQAGNVDPTGRPAPGYAPWLASLDGGAGLDGSGITVAIVDTGISYHHPDFAGRVVASFDYSSGSPVGEPGDFGGHGTHVAGIVGGLPQTPVALSDIGGFEYGLGVAPGVSFVRQNGIGELREKWPPTGGWQRLSKDAHSAGAKMWNASWTSGEGERVGYIMSARTMDEITRNADFDTPGSEEFLLVFSAGNSGGNGPTAPKEAKNIIAVGATASGRDLSTRPNRTNPEVVASFSSIGPTLDGRMFPTLVAPGQTVVAARSTETVDPLMFAACIPAPDGAALYTACSGTSMAAPHVTGAAALLHQWWQRHYGTTPSPAMTKAVLVNGSDDMLRFLFPVPNRLEGWGRLNLSSVFSGQAAIVDDQATVFGSAGQSASTTVTADDPSQPLKVTLAWSDAPAGYAASPALVNDLDLVVEELDAGGNVVATWLGNVFEANFSVTGGSADRLNNLENVYLKAPGSGTYRITVIARNLPGDGIPENADSTDQDFALLVRNAVAAP